MAAALVNLLDDLLGRSVRMALLVEDMVQESTEAVFSAADRLAQRVIARDRTVDAEEVGVESEAIRLIALHQPAGSDLRLLCTVLKVNNDLERVADCAVNIAERACHLDATWRPQVIEYVEKLAPPVQKMLHTVVDAYRLRDAACARQVFAEEEGVDARYGEVIRRAVEQGADWSQSVAGMLDVLSVAKNLERIADHTTNIAEDVIFLETGEIVRHQRRGPG